MTEAESVYISYFIANSKDIANRSWISRPLASVGGKALCISKTVVILKVFSVSHEQGLVKFKAVDKWKDGSSSNMPGTKDPPSFGRSSFTIPFPSKPKRSFSFLPAANLHSAFPASINNKMLKRNWMQQRPGSGMALLLKWYLKTQGLSSFSGRLQGKG